MVHTQDSELLLELKRLRNIEKAAIADVLICLREVDRRKLYLSKGFASLYEFCLVELGYNKDEAYYRISAMRLLKDAPQIETQIREGTLSLTVAAKAQIAFRREDQKRKELNQAPLAIEAKTQILRELAQCSKRETERTLAKHFPQDVPKETTRPISETRTLIQFSADQDLMEKLEKLQNLLAHKNYAGRWEALFSELADLALKKLEPRAPRSRPSALSPSSSIAESSVPSPSIFGNADAGPAIPCASTPSRPAPATSRDLMLDPQSERPTPGSFVPARKKRSYISVEIKRRLWRRADGQCEFVDISSGRRCTSRHALELDHKWPKALGGEDTEQNLRWLCRPHNAHAAKEVFQFS